MSLSDFSSFWTADHHPLTRTPKPSHKDYSFNTPKPCPSTPSPSLPSHPTIYHPPHQPRKHHQVTSPIPTPHQQPQTMKPSKNGKKVSLNSPSYSTSSFSPLQGNTLAENSPISVYPFILLILVWARWMEYRWPVEIVMSSKKTFELTGLAEAALS